LGEIEGTTRTGRAWTSIHFAVPVEEERLVFFPEVAVIEGW
jgi:hypothetical protein